MTQLRSRVEEAKASRTQLVRAVGLLSLTAIAINGMIGSGIFVLPATVAKLLGPLSPLAYLISGVAIVLIVLCFAEVGSRFERAGGPYLYAREAFGSLFRARGLAGARSVAQGAVVKTRVSM